MAAEKWEPFGTLTPEARVGDWRMLAEGQHKRIERLDAALTAMVGWFDLMAEKIGWTAENAGAAFDAYHNARSALYDPPEPPHQQGGEND